MATEARIMHVITDFSRPEGAQNMLSRILRQSEDTDKSMVVSLVGVSDEIKHAVRNQSITYYALNMQGPLGLPKAIKQLVSLIQSEKPTVVLCWMYHAMALGAIAGRITGTPFYWTVRQALDDTSTFGLSTKVALASCRALSQWPQGVIYNSANALKQHELYGYSNSNSVVIPNGFEMPEELLHRRSKPARTFGIAGRLHPQKDHTTFFSAAAKALSVNSELRFCLAGKGLSSDNPEVQTVMKAADAPVGNFEFHGELRDMGPFYRNIDALVLSSRTEGFPNVVAEAMSYGTPVITTNVGDAAEIVADTGMVCPVGDPDALAAALVSFSNLSAEAYEEKSRQARERVCANYSLDEITRRYLRFLEV